MVSQSSSVGYTIMGKTADLTVVQKTTIDTLHKEGKTQKVIAKEAGCSQSSVSKHINREAKGRKRCGRKKCTSNRDNRTLERIVKQNPFKNVGEIHKEWTAAGVSASRTTTHRRMQDMGFRVHVKSTFWWYSNYMTRTCIYINKCFILAENPRALKVSLLLQTTSLTVWQCFSLEVWEDGWRMLRSQMPVTSLQPLQRRSNLPQNIYFCVLKKKESHTDLN